MPQTWNEANIVLIHKAEKDPLHPGSYQPIAHLNTDAKIFMKAMANRLRQIITNYVHLDQMGFMLNRQITNNIHRTLNIMSHCQLQHIEAIPLKIK